MDLIANVFRIALLCLEVVFLFNLMIVVHEFGHFLAARWRGLVIDRFGVWFGKPLWKARYNGVDYCLGWIPMGGYVALPQMAPMEMIEGKGEEAPRRLPPIKPIDKIIVAAAGPLFSILLAFVFAVVVMMIGKPVSQGEESTVVGYVVPGMPAAEAICAELGPDDKGLKPGDNILEVDGHPVKRFGGMTDGIKWRIVRSEGDTIPFVVERDGKRLTFLSKFEREPKRFWQRKALREVGLGPEQQPMVAKVLPNTAPAEAGLQPNDVIMAVNGEKVYSQYGFEDLLAKQPGEPAELTVRRNGESLQLKLPPLHPMIAGVQQVKNSPSIAAGLKVGDIVTAMNDEPIYSARQMIRFTSESNGVPIRMTVERDGKPLELTVRPALARVDNDVKPGYRMGVELTSEFVWDAIGSTRLAHPNPLGEVLGGVTTMINTFGAILSPKSDIKLEQMGGPLQITRVYYIFLESPDGWRRALWFSILLNVNLAIMNLLPLPVLDGGHITMGLIEMIRRRPLNVRVMEMIQSVGVVMLLGFMLYVTFYDVGDLASLIRPKSTFEFVAPE